MADYVYTCVNAGHEGEREFIAADPGWFADHGLSTPVNCPACRAWIRGLEDEVWHCAVCKKRRTYTAAYKEAFHRSQGKFVLPEVCGEACAKKLEKQRTAEQRRLEAERQKALKKQALQELMRDVEERQVLASANSVVNAEDSSLQDELLEDQEIASFKELPDLLDLPEAKVSTKLSAYRRHHIERHLPAFGGTRSPSALVDARASLDEMIDAISWTAEQTGLPKRIYRQPDGKYVCLTEIEDGRIEVTIFVLRQRMLLPSRLEPITSYDGVSLNYVTDRLADERWMRH